MSDASRPAPATAGLLRAVGRWQILGLPLALYHFSQAEGRKWRRLSVLRRHLGFTAMNCLTWWIDLLLARRLIISFVTSIVIALGVYYVGGETPALAAVAFFIGLVGLCVGLIWHIAGGKSGAT